MESKLQFIRAWQALPEFGLTLFLVKHQKQKKEELLGKLYRVILQQKKEELLGE